MGIELLKGQLTSWRSLAVTGGIASMFLLGAFAAGLFLSDASNTTLAIVLSFGSAALIYLIAEELLVETIEAEKSLFPTVTLFTGFATLLALKLLSG